MTAQLKYEFPEDLVLIVQYFVCKSPFEWSNESMIFSVM